MRSNPCAGLALVLLLAAPVRADPDPKTGRYAEVFSVSSGLRVALHTEPGRGTVAVCSSFPGGLARDGVHHGALASAVAETVREGGRRARSAEYSRLLESRGARTQIFMGNDRVEFCTQAPAHELELALWLERGRSHPYAFTAENFAERLSELSLGGDYVPLEAVAARTRQLAFPEAQRGGRSPVTLDAARQFHTDHYRPDGAVLSIAGDFDAESARAKIEQLFQDPPPSGALPAAQPVPRQTSPRYMSLEDESLVATLHERAWVVPGPGSSDHAALELAAEVLAGNSDSVLHESLLVPGLARGIKHGFEPRSGSDLLSVTIELSRQRHDVDLVALVDQAVWRLGAAPPRPEQLERARARLRVRRAFARQAPLGQARWLSRRLGYGLEPDPSAEERALSQVRPEDVRRVVTSYLSESRRIVVEFLPREAREPFPNVVPRFHVVREGEALARIARREGTTVAELLRLNDLDKKKTLQPGQKLRLPPGKPRKVHVVKKGETLIGIGKRYGVSVDAIRRENKLGKNSVIRAGSSLTIPR